jgi:hypothetical protein
MSSLMHIPYIIGFIFLLSCHPALATKKECQPYLDKLRNIQSQQRAGYSNKKGRSLAEREKLARKKWWQCQKGKQPKNKNKKANYKLKKKTKINQEVKKPKTYDDFSSENFTNKLTIKAKYQGRKQQDWLDFYKQPKQCKKPKTIKVFAYCIENKNKQHLNFEHTY